MMENDFKNEFVKLFRQYHDDDFHYCPADRITRGIPDFITLQQDIFTSIEFKVVRNGKTKFRPLQIETSIQIDENNINARGIFLCRMEFDYLKEALYCVFNPSQMIDGIYKDTDHDPRWNHYVMSKYELEYWIYRLPNSPVPSSMHYTKFFIKAEKWQAARKNARS